MPHPIPPQPIPPLRADRRPSALLILGLALSALALAGCANRPTATGFLPSAQQKLQSAGHWQVVADDVASAVSAYLEKQGPAGAAKPPISLIMQTGDGTAFGDAFADSLRTSFVRRGHPVALRPRDGTVTVGIDTAVIRHQPGGRTAWTTPGPVTMLAAGAAVGAWMLDSFPWGATAVPLGLGADAVLAKPSETDTELLLTVSIERDGFHVFRSAAVYYIDGRDSGMYESFGAAAFRSLNEVPQGAIAYDIAGKPYVMRERR